MIYKIRILDYACFLRKPKGNYQSHLYALMQSYEQMINYFFPNIDFVIVPSHEKADICLTSVGMPTNSILRDDEVNIFICIENMANQNFNIYYSHYKNYNEYDDEKIQIYIYSHITKIIETKNYLAIPCIYSRINYFKNNYDHYYNHPRLNKKFNEKKFCILVTKTSLNQLRFIVKNEIDKLNIGYVENLFNNTDIIDKSCYNSIEFLEVVNQYKFAICFENSRNDGYITEKIFNCFFAKTIPIYWGSELILNYFNDKSFILYEENNKNWIDKLKLLNENETIYNEYINANKISDNYDDENYKERLMTKINNIIKLE